MPAAQQTLAQLTYQRLFSRYHQIGGMSGTLAEVAPEMALTYGTPVLRIERVAYTFDRRPAEYRLSVVDTHDVDYVSRMRDAA